MRQSKKKKRPVIEPSAGDTEKDNWLTGLFDEKQLRKILIKVYRSDEVYKEHSFKRLSSCRTWTEATEHLREIFQDNKVNIYNKDVVKFVNILNDYFQNRE